jgi:hypothetical protein
VDIRQKMLAVSKGQKFRGIPSPAVAGTAHWYCLPRKKLRHIRAHQSRGTTEMTDFSDDELHTKPVTFMGATYTHDLSGAKAAVLGVHSTAGFTLSGSDPDKARLQYVANRFWCDGIIRNSPTSTLSSASVLSTAAM